MTIDTRKETTRAKLARWLDKLVALQIRRPAVVLLAVLAVSVPALILSLRLDLKTDFAELLPENKPSVLELNRVRKRMLSASTLSVVAKSKDTAALERFVDEMVPRISALGPAYVTNVDPGVQELQRFVEKNKLLFAPFEDIQKIHDDVAERYGHSMAKAMGTSLLDDDEEKEEEKPGSTKVTGDLLSDIRSRVDEITAREKKNHPHAEGYYLSDDRATIVLLIKTPIEMSDLARQHEMLGLVNKIIAEVNPKRLAPDMQIAFTGDLITGPENYRTIKNDLTDVGELGLLLILGVVFLYFLQVRTLVSLAATIGIGLVWTFAVARLAIGHLNTSTGFLVSIIAGNGINFGIIYMARYLEARNRDKLDVAAAIRVAHRETWLATLASSATAMCAYGSLAITDFKGFKHFGVIGGSGMALCWLATYLAIPPMLSLSERVSSAVVADNSLRGRAQGSYGRVFGYLCNRFHRIIVLVGVVVGLGSAVLAFRFFYQDPMEYDLRKIRNEPRIQSEAQRISGEVDDIVGRIGQEGMAILVDRLDQVAPLKATLDQRRDAVPKAERPFDKVVTMFEMLPPRQEEKIEMIDRTARKLRRGYERGIFSEKEWSQIDELLPREKLRPIGLADLPDKMAAPFTEIDGTRGRIVYIVPRTDRSVWNAEYLHTWADSYRETKLPSGEVILGSGRAVIISDMLHAVAEDAPKAIVASFAGTMLVILLTFGLKRVCLGVLSTIVLGTCLMLAFMHLKGIKFTFLNFVVLPITLGIGADYAINIMRRVEIEGDEGIAKAVVETGGAVVLCSLTTILGYSALLFSINRAISGFGMAAAFGEVACLSSALLVLPSAIIWLQRRRARG
jgi:hypothetical protein